MSQEILATLSSELAGVVARVAPSLVRVDDGTRLTATGIIWSPDGLILTTSHGVERDDDVTIVLGDGARYPATVVGRDPETDLALLQITAQGLTPLPQADPNAVKVGNLALALGRPGEAGLQATLGIVSARLEAQNNGQEEYILNTDATLYPGFSGGPLVDMSGRLIGLLNLALGRGQGVALGVPVLNHVAETLQTQGQVKRGYLGISTQPVSLPTALRTALGLEQTLALLVAQVAEGSPAEHGGLQLGDLLLRLGDEPVPDPETLRKRLRALAAGTSVTLKIARAGQAQDLTVTLGSVE